MYDGSENEEHKVKNLLMSLVTTYVLLTKVNISLVIWDNYSS
jgi:hypothetical protein